MKKALFSIMMIMSLGFQTDIYAQITCTDVIFPHCPLIFVDTIPPSPSPNPNCPSIEIIDPTDFGTITHVGTGGNLEDQFGNLSYFYALDTTSNCFADEFMVVECCNAAARTTCDTIIYHIELQCETPDDVFCCTSPDDDSYLDVLGNDNSFINDNYPGATILDIEVDHSPEDIPLGSVVLQPDDTFEFDPNGGTGVTSFTYELTYTIVTATGDTITICDEQTCYVFVEDCINTISDEISLSIGQTACINPLANDFVEPTLSDPILNSIGCTNPDPLPVFDPVTQPTPQNSGLMLTGDGMDGWCLTSASVGTYTYTYDACTDAGSCVTETMQFNVFPTCVLEDYIALRALYLSTDGDNWVNNTGWPDEATFLANPTSPPPGFTSFDTWYDITVDGSGCVTHLYLRSNQLSGSIPPEIGNLGSLRLLSLHSNEISGSIPSEIGNLTSLVHLHLHKNQLSCNIPPEIGNLSNLTILNLYRNQLSGDIPAEIGNLNLLTRINMSTNQLSGSIPAEIGNLNNLTYLLLGVNQLTGSIPVEIINMSALTNLDLRHNQLSGNIPPEIGDLSNLIIDLSHNQLTGCYDANLSSFCTQPAYDNARISDGNSFDADWEDFCGTGAGSCDCSIDDYLALRALYLSTDGDNWSNNTNWLNAATFLANPNSPPVGTNLSMWYGVTVDAGCVSDLNLNGNNLVGTISGELDKLRKITYLNLSNNQLTGNIPSKLGNMVNLTNLDLSDNQLTGNLTAELGYLRQLNILDVRNNQLSGSFDIELLNLCGQLIAPLIDTGNNFDTNWADFCFDGAGTCDCPINDNITGTLSSNTYQAAQTLTSSAEVLSGENVMFKAGELIKLDAGFTVQPNADFSGEIEDCTPQ